MYWTDMVANSQDGHSRGNAATMFRRIIEVGTGIPELTIDQ